MRSFSPAAFRPKLVRWVACGESVYRGVGCRLRGRHPMDDEGNVRKIEDEFRSS
ncbi:MAG: hypothetical protein MUP27_13495 [Desulfobacterales bacterium]|nr:hypothetical protein [Desulfobacterales bacterium]